VIRAYAYMAASGVIWLAEGFLFSHYLGLAAWQLVLLAVLYLGLFGAAVFYMVRTLRATPPAPDGLSAWRIVSLAPMLVVILGSFASLPLILAVVALGKL
jgi:hypothetical protein